MTQLTLVALYGDKPPELSAYVVNCQEIISSVLDDGFEPYDIRQVHATIVGLEYHGSSIRENACFHRLRDRRVEMDTSRFFQFLRNAPELPFQVQIGGFGDTDRPFLSRNASPYMRSFSIQGDKAVVIGWPRRIGSADGRVEHPLILDALRRRAQEYGILHAYHASETDLDNDLFLRIGLIDQDAVSEDAVQDLEEGIRQRMSRQPPLLLRIGLDDLDVAVYEDERLPLGSTQIWPLSAPGLGARLEPIFRR